MKDLIMYVGTPPKNTDGLRASFASKLSVRIGVLYDKKRNIDALVKKERYDIVLPCNLESPTAITKALLPHEDTLLAVTSIDEKSILRLQKVIPHVPYVHTPTVESLTWATNKMLMRRFLRVYDPSISPAYMLVHRPDEETFDRVEKKIGFPLVIKPIGLSRSLLVSICYHREELERSLKKTFRTIKKVHKHDEGRGEPIVLVEQFMEGKMYSIDAYVSAKGAVHFCPLVHVKTGREIGFDDFFGYQRITPTMLKKESIEAAETVGRKAIHALGLRSTTVHIELMRTREGWKIIELGPRMGGYRHTMYMLSYGIDHKMNDVLVRIPQNPIIPKKIKGYTAVLLFFAKKEGVLRTVRGIQRITKLRSFNALHIKKKKGDLCTFVRNGGTQVFNVTFFNADRAQLLTDIRRTEQMIKIETERA